MRGSTASRSPGAFPCANPTSKRWCFCRCNEGLGSGKVWPSRFSFRTSTLPTPITTGHRPLPCEGRGRWPFRRLTCYVGRMTTYSIALAAVLSLVPETPPQRAAELADNAAVAVAFAGSPFTGDAREEAAAVAVITIAFHEGYRFSRAVERCEITADNDKTVSLFGLMKGAAWRGRQRHELCGGGPLPAYLGLLALQGYAERCTRSTPLGFFQGYASGSCNVKSDASARLCTIWERVSARVGLLGASCHGRRDVTLRPEPLRVSEAS